MRFGTRPSLDGPAVGSNSDALPVEARRGVPLGICSQKWSPVLKMRMVRFRVEIRGWGSEPAFDGINEEGGSRFFNTRFA